MNEPNVLNGRGHALQEIHPRQFRSREAPAFGPFPTRGLEENFIHSQKSAGPNGKGHVPYKATQ
jgi:hypothetical protein